MPPEADSSSQYISDWIALEAGEFYHIEGYHMEWSGGDHFSVAVEFEQADTAGHHHARKEVQVLSIDPENNFEEFQITISGATGTGNFKVQFVNPLYNPDDEDSSPFWMSDSISDDTSADNLRSKI